MQKTKINLIKWMKKFNRGSRPEARRDAVRPRCVGGRVVQRRQELLERESPFGLKGKTSGVAFEKNSELMMIDRFMLKNCTPVVR